MDTENSVYQYVDYRAFLRELIQSRKQTDRTFSLGRLSRKAPGFSKAYLSLILSGKRNVSSAKIAALGQAVDLEGDHLRYFQSLVRFNQAKTAEEKRFFFERMMEARPRTEARLLEQDQYEVLRNWHCLVLRELVRLPDFDPQPAAISARCRGRLSPSEAKDALDLLVRTGLVARTDAGEYKAGEETLRTSDEVRSIAVQQYHESCLELGKQALRQDPLESREFASVNFALTEDQVQWVKRRLKDLRDEVGGLPVQGGERRKVCQLNLQFFVVAE